MKHFLAGIAIVAMVALAIGYSHREKEPYLEPYIQGDLSNYDGTPTVRYADTPYYEDDPYTTNDESNDQPPGYYGTETVYACTTHNERCYELDADFSDGYLERLYFPKGGWVDFEESDECVRGDGCVAIDENGREWEVTVD